MFKRLIVLLLLLGPLTAPVAFAANGGKNERVALLEMSKADAPGFSRVSLVFPKLPVAKVALSGQRIDLLLSNTALTPGLRTLPEDAEIVDVLLGEKNGEAILSFLVRRTVRRAELTPDSKTQTLYLDIFWEEGATRRRPAIAFGLAGVPTLNAGSASVSRSVSSRYQGRWEAFYADYETPLEIPLSPQYTLPPFPLFLSPPGIDWTLAPADVVEKGNQGVWGAALTSLESAAGDGLRQKSPGLFQVAKGELLLRSGDAAKARQMLGMPVDETTEPTLGPYRRFLLAQAKAASDDPYGASCEVDERRLNLADSSPLKPYADLFRAELALAAGHLHVAYNRLEALRGGLPVELTDRVALRQADILGMNGKSEAALEAYRHLDEKGILDGHPLSLFRFAQLLDRQKDYAGADDLYHRLAMQLAGKRYEDLAYFAAARAQLRDGHAEMATAQLENVCRTFPGREGAWRSRLLLCDQQALSANAGDKDQSARGYRQLTGDIVHRELREEAAFKYALTLFLGGRKHDCVMSLQDFLRDYSAGRLTNQGKALMVDALPDVIRDLVAQGNPLDALVLVEKNRELLLGAQVGRSFLLELGGVFTKLGFWDRAAHLYFYLLDGDMPDQEVENVYLPLVQCLHEKGDVDLVGEYVDRYRKRFPNGSYGSDLFRLQAETLIEADRLEEASRLFRQPGRPQSPEIDRMAAGVFMRLENYSEVDRCLAPLMDRNLQEAPSEDVFMRAEALFRNGQTGQALPLFAALTERDGYKDQALYRLAQVYLATGRADMGVKVLTQLTEEGSSELWKKMAREAIALQKGKP